MFVNATKRLRSSLLRVHLAVNTRRLCTSSLGGSSCLMNATKRLRSSLL